MSSDLETKMNRLLERMDDGRPDHLEEVKAMQKTLKSAMLKKNLKEHPALQQLLSTLKKREESYTTLLANKEDLPQEKRDALYNRRKEIRFILSFFNVESVLASLESTLDYQLSDEVKDLSTGDA